MGFKRRKKERESARAQLIFLLFLLCSKRIQGAGLANGCVNLMVESLEGDFYKCLLHAYNQRKKTLKFHKTKRNRTLTIKCQFS